MRNEYDVIVVGAGPGGSTAARHAAAACDVLLVEKRQAIGEPVRCAEGVPLWQSPVFPKSFSEYVQPDPKWIASEVRRIRATSPDGTTIEVSEDTFGVDGPLGFIIERKLFDRQLAKEAARAGADIMVRTRATGLIIDEETVTGVRVNRLGDDFELTAKVVIAADGVESQVGRWGGINTTLEANNIASCAQYYAENVDVTEATVDLYYGSDIGGGYAWVFPKGDTAANLGLAVPGSRCASKRPIDYLDEFTAKHFPSAQPIGLILGGTAISNKLHTIVRNGLMLVGDAAHHTDPLTGGGIVPALESGTIAGEVASKAVRKNDPSESVLREYEAEYNRSFGTSRKLRYKCKELAVSLSDEEIIRVMRVFDGIQPGELNLKGIIMRFLRKDPRLLLKVGQLV
ncbi:MAG: NAD(P)/FAD-dependent oxidoreductase [Halobacteriota archaeon]